MSELQSLTGTINYDRVYPTIDPSLSIEGAAADAKAAGDAVRKAAPHNLLDNSDFRNPVNQRGNTIYNTLGYTIDRWSAWHAGSGCTLEVKDGYISFTAVGHATLSQRIQKGVLDSAKTYTLVKKFADGSITLSTRAVTYSTNYDGVTVSDITDKTESLVWAALYEGEYTANTLPEYQPKGYGAELIECQRYFIKFDANSNLQFLPGASNGSAVFSPLHLPVTMRIIPTLGYGNVNIYNYKSGGNVECNNLLIETAAKSKNVLSLMAQYNPTADLPTQCPGCIRILSGGFIELSADL